MMQELRGPREFMTWNHVFMAYETYRASGSDSALFCMALPCTVLSITRHVHGE